MAVSPSTSNSVVKTSISALDLNAGGRRVWPRWAAQSDVELSDDSVDVGEQAYPASKEVHAELGMVGFTVSLATASRYRPKRPGNKGKQQRRKPVDVEFD